MSGTRVILTAGLILFTALSASAQTTLYVNGATGNDSVSKANNSASNPWRTIGRAAWGSTSRSAPNPSEAAAAGDTVSIAGGTYDYGGTINFRWGVVYNPANHGTSANPITFRCDGTCTLTARSANSPVIGASERNYIKWYADVARGHAWAIQACGLQSAPAGCPENFVNTTPDTGPVACQGTTGCWIEGATIHGGPQTDYNDNWDGIRTEGARSTTIRYNTITSFHLLTYGGGNGACLKIYYSPDSLIEHNDLSNCGTAVAWKDTGGSTLPQENVRVRFNHILNVNYCLSMSQTAEGRNYFYQNVCTNSRFGWFITGGGTSGDWIFNNTYYNLLASGVYPTSLGFGGRFWNNIVVNADRVVLLEGGSMPDSSVIDLEHNVYFGHRQFYSGTDGNLSFSSFRSAYPTHNADAPLSVEANPLFVNASQGDFRLCTGAGNPAPSCTGASPALAIGLDFFDLDGDGNTSEAIRAGAFVTNNESMGVSGGVRRPPSSPTDLHVIRP